MKKFKHILIILLLVGTTLAIYGGIKSKPVVRKDETSEPVDKRPHGFPDLIGFANYINQ